jgi:hypothetical protein
LIAMLRIAATALVAATLATSAGAQDIEPLPPPSAVPPAYSAVTPPATPRAASVFGDFVDENPNPQATDSSSPYPLIAEPAYADPIFPARPDPWDSPSAGLPWVWQLMPEGLIWRSYLAGVKEPRLGVVMTGQSGFGTIWDSTLGGRVSLVRYGTTTAYRPEGFEVDLEGAATTRIQPDEFSSPLVSADFRIGIPVTYGVGPWQFKTGYTHVSSHLGDEYMLQHPTVSRINYTRDSIMFGVGYYYTEALRLYAEFDYAAGVSGGAEPCEFQFGVDYSPAVRHGAPFFAVYGDLRQEVDFGGFFVAQTGWQWRGGDAMHTLRLGVEYFNGQSAQFEFFNTFEQHVGFGIWYDF